MLKVVKYTDLVPRMLRDLTNYAPATTLFALQDAGRQFCDQSEAWYEKLTALDLVANQQEYGLSTDYVAQMKRIKSVHILTDEDVTAGREGKLVDPAHYRLDLPGTLKFFEGFIPASSVTGGLVVEVVFVPTMGTSELPEWIMARWAEGIIGHAMNHLLRTTDANKADIYLHDFNAKMGEAMVESMEDPHP